VAELCLQGSRGRDECASALTEKRPTVFVHPKLHHLWGDTLTFPKNNGVLLEIRQKKPNNVDIWFWTKMWKCGHPQDSSKTVMGNHIFYQKSEANPWHDEPPRRSQALRKISQDAQWQRAPSLSRCPGRYLSAVMAADICGLCLKMMYTIIPFYNPPKVPGKQQEHGH
jgi:hypothetical protein